MTLHFRRVMFAPAVAGLLVAGFACGDDSGGGSPAGLSGPEADERYVQQLCTGFGDFTTSFLDAIADLDAESSDDAIKDALEEPIDNLVKVMEDADPPADAREYHDESLKQIRAMQEEIRAGNIEALTNQDAEVVPEPPADVRERLTAAAANIEDCQGLAIFE